MYMQKGQAVQTINKTFLKVQHPLYIYNSIFNFLEYFSRKNKSEGSNIKNLLK